MRWVTANPPTMLTLDRNTAAKAQATRAESSGPLSCSMPPTTIMPLMALVTLMSGVWRAGVTPATVKWPIRQERTKYPMCVSSASGMLVANPRPSTVAAPSPSAISALCSSSHAMTRETSAGTAGGTPPDAWPASGDGDALAGRGGVSAGSGVGGQSTWPSRVTVACWMTWSSQWAPPKSAAPPRASSRATKLLPNISLACPGICEG
mmetsp:Transcript_106341/g.333457  ORF Transcript_106341/g.333457 Transcript_106341/m.333457 type:complete len:207 (-) Transcript_106341:283-903(-)